MLRFLLTVVACEECLIVCVPFSKEFRTALLDPPLEISLCNLIGMVEDRVVWHQNGYLCILFGDFLWSSAHCIRIGTEGCRIKFRGLILNDEVAASMHVIKESAVIGDEISPNGIRSDANENRVKLIQITGAEFLPIKHLHVNTDLLQSLGYLVAYTHDIADAQIRWDFEWDAAKRHDSRVIQVPRFKIWMINCLIASRIFLAIILRDCLNCVFPAGFNILGRYLKSKHFACAFVCKSERCVLRR